MRSLRSAIGGVRIPRVICSQEIVLQEGLLRVLLDGGPTRVFADTDSDMLEEDLSSLKVDVFFQLHHQFALATLRWFASEIALKAVLLSLNRTSSK